MAYPDLDSTYRERLTWPIYTPAISLSREMHLRTKRTYGIGEPSRLARAWFLFGYFDGSSKLQCQPFAASSREDMHGEVLHEIRAEHRQRDYRLSFNGGRALTGHAWSIYMGSHDGAPEHMIAFQGIASEDHVLFDEKLAAVANSTNTGEVLEGHTICARTLDHSQRFVIEDGAVFTVARGILRDTTRTPYQPLAA